MSEPFNQWVKSTNKRRLLANGHQPSSSVNIPDTDIVVGLYEEMSGLRRSHERTKDELLTIINTLSSETDKKVKEMYKKSIALDKKTAALEEKADEIKSQAREEKINFITFTGIFVAIFTFISIEISIIRETNEILRIAGLSILTAGLIIFFVLLISHIAKTSIPVTNYQKFSSILIYIAAIALVGIGILLISNGDTRYKDTIDLKIKDIQDTLNESKLITNE